MATRSLIGKYDGADQWKCRYVHWDGYPEGVGAELCKIVARDGVERAMRMLLNEYTYGWSSVRGDRPSDEFIASESTQQKEYVDGYGFAYGPDRGEDWWWDRSDSADARYAYIIVPHQKMLDVYERLSDRPVWQYVAAMDCLTMKMLTTTGELKVMA